MKNIILALCIAFVPAGAGADEDFCSCGDTRPLAVFSEDPLIEPMDDGLVPMVSIDTAKGCFVTIDFVAGEQTTYEIDGVQYLMFSVPTENGLVQMSLDDVHQHTNAACGGSPSADTQTNNAVTS